jgi:hypothetical protein
MVRVKPANTNKLGFRKKSFTSNHLPEVLVLLYARQRAAELGEVLLPVANLDVSFTICRSNELSDVACCTPIHHRLHARQRIDRVASECLLEKAKTPVRRELGVSRHQKVECYGFVVIIGHSPHEIKQDKIVLILP